MSNFFRITGYHRGKDFSFIMDCNGAYEKLWQFSSYLVKQGFEVLEVGDSDKFLDGNVRRMEVDKEKIGYWCIASGRPIYKTVDIDGISYQIVQVGELYYVPDRNNALNNKIYCRGSALRFSAKIYDCICELCRTVNF